MANKDYPYDNPIDFGVQYGDLFSLNDTHFLMCGNSVEKEDIEYLMRSNKAKILFTSPPYADVRTYNGDKELSIDYLKNFISLFEPYTDHQCINLGIIRKNYDIQCYWNEYIDAGREAGYKLLAWNVWDKHHAGSIAQQRAFIPIQHEWIFVFGKQYYDINKTVPKKTRNQPKYKKRRHADGSMFYSTTNASSDPLKKMGSVTNCYAETGKIRSQHPATYPVTLPKTYVEALTDENDIVIDCFGGSGTTLIACEELNRKCFMMELDTDYCNVILNRWQHITGGTVEKVGNCYGS